MAEVRGILERLDVGTPLPVPQMGGIPEAPTSPVALAPTVALGDASPVPAPVVTAREQSFVPWVLGGVGFVVVMLAVAWLVRRLSG